jgi:hypothetical protein
MIFYIKFLYTLIITSSLLYFKLKTNKLNSASNNIKFTSFYELIEKLIFQILKNNSYRFIKLLLSIQKKIPKFK